MPDTLSANFISPTSPIFRGHRHLKERGAQLALLDLGLPDSSGLDTVRQVRQAARRSHRGVTGHDDEAIGIAAEKPAPRATRSRERFPGDLLARVFLHAVERHQHQESLRRLNGFFSQLWTHCRPRLPSFPSGKIFAVNHSWQEFAVTNGANRTDGFIGVDYRAVVTRLLAKEKRSRSLAAGIRAVIDGATTSGMEYPCHSPDQKRWFSWTGDALFG